MSDKPSFGDAFSSVDKLDKDDRIYAFIVVCAFIALAFGVAWYHVLASAFGLAVLWPFVRWLRSMLEANSTHRRQKVAWQAKSKEIAGQFATQAESEAVKQSILDFDRGEPNDHD
ncbi:hypothetical protein [Fulvimarina sp. MAC8]|uniref:hypothetical protein n=1 Tax=Fulvimarina sp. MAC8 TaxID=3162874 RepID=UPI0032EC23C3